LDESFYVAKKIEDPKIKLETGINEWERMTIESLLVNHTQNTNEVYLMISNNNHTTICPE
jgi:hypothetical protein